MKWRDIMTDQDFRLNDPLRCNNCAGKFDEEEIAGFPVMYQTLKNRRFAATLDDDGNVIQECCEDCAQELMEETGE